MTTYVILQRAKAIPDESPKYEQKGKIEAHRSKSALAAAGEKWGNGTYVAVKADQWIEAPVATETITKVRVGA